MEGVEGVEGVQVQSPSARFAGNRAYLSLSLGLSFLLFASSESYVITADPQAGRGKSEKEDPEENSSGALISSLTLKVLSLPVMVFAH